MPKDNDRARTGREEPDRDPQTNTPEKRPGPYAQDLSREPPTREQRERDYEGRRKPQ